MFEIFQICLLVCVFSDVLNKAQHNPPLHYAIYAEDGGEPFSIDETYGHLRVTNSNAFNCQKKPTILLNIKAFVAETGSSRSRQAIQAYAQVCLEEQNNCL